MKIKTSKSIIYLKEYNNNKEIPFIFLHGFSGTSSSWINIINKHNKFSYTVDLPGHGKSTFINISTEYTINDWCNELYMILNELSLKKINLCGYSMGGRLSIAFAHKFPEKINSLLLESTSLGLNESEVRSERYYKDLERADEINRDLKSFMDNWEKNSLFINQKKRNVKEWQMQANERIKHDPKQLSKALMAFSPSNMIYYDKPFQEFNFPIHVINGSDDDKYIKIGREMIRLNKNTKQYIIENAGHNTHLENPDMFLDVLNQNIYE